ncbi:threonine synthase [Enterobacteriaceae endosymbiont of Macroplea appendiculata]|uniref:threonine synthase n=1 Tax=Enterobacteriaceae endosymbiont of Macroplea appendiculata TaxID=2675790 RepID=UPI00145749CF|nr:threonine synthase [Enterobacteriaceae endosymbiont of Macroplea appendiculata]
MFINLNDITQKVDFIKALKIGLGRKQGLFFPYAIPKLDDKIMYKLLIQDDFITCSSKILSYFIDNKRLSLKDLKKIIKKAFNFPLKLQLLSHNLACFELFHGPTLSFKDFGVRFMAQVLHYFYHNEKIIILTATSGDTGAAVAHAFYKIPNIEVIILYPYNKITSLQKKLFCTLKNNVTSIAIEGDFDDCQRLIKKSFSDTELTNIFNLNSANSINISRLLAQICYYFELYKQTSKYSKSKKIIISVPSGNFGNLTAGLIAKNMGLPIHNIIAATNINDTVVQYLQHGYWKPQQTLSTLSNAMDVSIPNNWPRILKIFNDNHCAINKLEAYSITDYITSQNIKMLFQRYKYISEPHAAVGFSALQYKYCTPDTFNIFLGTAHPAKFQKYILQLLKYKVLLPNVLLYYAKKNNQKHVLPNNFNVFKNFLKKHIKI